MNIILGKIPLIDTFNFPECTSSLDTMHLFTRTLTSLQVKFTLISREIISYSSI